VAIVADLLVAVVAVVTATLRILQQKLAVPEAVVV
jgi:hypothetical protein